MMLFARNNHIARLCLGPCMFGRYMLYSRLYHIYMLLFCQVLLQCQLLLLGADRLCYRHCLPIGTMPLLLWRRKCHGLLMPTGL